MAARLAVEEGNVAIYDVLGSGDHERIEALLELYARLFPQYEHYVPRMRRRAEFGAEHRAGHIVHYWLAEVDGRPAGLRTFRYVRNRHCGLAHALAVDPAFRGTTVGGKRLAVFMIYECLNQIIRDAQAAGDEPPLGMVNEVDPDELMKHYIRNGLIQLPIDYVEPIFAPEAQGRSREDEINAAEFHPMKMGFLPNPQVKIEGYSKEMIENFALAFLTDHYGVPAEHPAVRQTLSTIKRSEHA
ncbi:MAG: GNAT family N-acetyltransferase [Anaerolineales bacterium]|nr:GNAT family N-acetyltransferase [Anaerolineales bacterium]